MLKILIITGIFFLLGCTSKKELEIDVEDHGITLNLQLQTEEPAGGLTMLVYQVFTVDGKAVPEQGSGNLQREYSGQTLQNVFLKGIQENLPSGTYHLVFTGYTEKEGEYTAIQLLDSPGDTLLMAAEGKPINGDYFYAYATISPENTSQVINLQRKVGKVKITLSGADQLLTKVSEVSVVFGTPEDTYQLMKADGVYGNLPETEAMSYNHQPDPIHRISFYSLPTLSETGCVAMIQVSFDGSETDKLIYLMPEDGFHIAVNRTTHIKVQLSSENDPLNPVVQVDTSWGVVNETNVNGEIDLATRYQTGFRLQIGLPDGWSFDNTMQNQTGATSMADFDHLELQDRKSSIPQMIIPITVLNDRTILTDLVTYEPTTLTPYAYTLTPKAGSNAYMGLGSHNIRWTIPIIKDKICTYAIKVTEVAEGQIQLIKEEQILE